jgi:trehalose 6-phosphate phosphatase
MAGFVLDYDGTLSDIVADPEAAEPVAGAIEVVAELAARYRLMALVSGRRAEFLANLFGANNGVRYYGVYGAEEHREGRLLLPPETDSWRGMASRIARDAEAFIHTEGLEGCEVEYKDVAVSIHFRNAENPRYGTLLVDWARDAASKRRFIANLGRMVVELRPQRVSKAETLRRLISETALEFVLAGGDDHADVEALAMAKELLDDRALTVGVASPEQPPNLERICDLMVASPTQMVEMLREFLGYKMPSPGTSDGSG